MSRFKRAFESFSDPAEESKKDAAKESDDNFNSRGKKWKPSVPARENPGSLENSTAGGSSSSSSSNNQKSTAEKHLREIVGNFFLSNKISAKDCHELSAGATLDGASGVEDFAKAGASGTQPGNLHRDILRKMLKDCTWPKEYFAEISVKTDTGGTEQISFPFLLPHEMFRQLILANGNKMNEFLGGGHTTTLVQEFCEKFQLGFDKVIPLGLHGDGAPFAAKMKDSLEQLSWSFASDPVSPRIVFTAIPKSFVGDQTMNQILDVFSWSMRCLLMGEMPSIRHDGQPFHPDTDKDRIKTAGQKLKYHAALIQIRGDWMFYCNTFHFRSWSNDLICWLCAASKDRGSENDFRQCGSLANWRKTRYQRGDFERMLRTKGQLSPIFKTPGLEIRHFLIDWLHAVDLGVGQSVVGNALYEIMLLQQGTNQEQKLNALWMRLKHYYKTYKVESRFDRLTLEMLKQPGKGPKLRSKAAECRYLLPFTAMLAREYDNGTPHRSTVRHMVDHLLTVAECLASQEFDIETAKDSCKKCCLLYSSLESEALSKGDELSWRMKPKFHMFQELLEYICDFAGSPKCFWTYRDESWGGFLSKVATRRGGPKFAANIALNLLQKYRCCVTDQL